MLGLRCVSPDVMWRNMATIYTIGKCLAINLRHRSEHCRRTSQQGAFPTCLLLVLHLPLGNDEQVMLIVVLQPHP